ncbi:DNA polymerase alpha subunit B isoform X2 [Neocloeon triangulifer]|uniref:DNA polymerase alpha subunit B isoform X2 n=1 Tax=Neocloeon triangulifer TaxID=2078957 RepID=UPI00286F04A4|nr:DNA polymerase alpha subunit B isoform X2 [Neocloeon triangulifer]
MVKKDAIAAEFENVGVSKLSDGTLSKCLDICDDFELTEEELAEQWVAFSASHLGWHNKLDEDILARMVAEMEKERNKAKNRIIQKPKNTPKTNLSSSIPSGYVTPQRAKPVSRIASEHDSSLADFSPASYSPAIFSPSGKKAASATSGKVAFEFGSTNGASWKSGNENRVTIESMATGSGVLASNYKFMYEPIHLTKAILADRVDFLGEQLRKQNDLPEFSLMEEQQEETTFVGRIGCNADDLKLTSNSVVITGSADRDAEVSLNLHKLEDYALFSGQVVAIKAHSAADKLVPTKVFSSVDLKFPDKPITFDFTTGPMEMVVAAGPYTHSDSLTYEPLQALMQYVKEHKPHLLVLCGPFVDSIQQHVQDSVIDDSYELFFMRLLIDALKPISNSHTQIVVVSSSRDAHHLPIFPSPPYTISPADKKDLPNNVTFVSDPCLLDVDGVIVGITSTDILKHIGPCEIASQGTDRLGRLASHVLHQASFYPLYPPQANIHLEAWEKFGQLPVKPHVLVLPSDLRFFVKNVDDSLVVNPERLAKGVSGGTFARLEIAKPADDKPFPDSVRAQIVKI